MEEGSWEQAVAKVGENAEDMLTGLGVGGGSSCHLALLPLRGILAEAERGKQV